MIFVFRTLVVQGLCLKSNVYKLKQQMAKKVMKWLLVTSHFLKFGLTVFDCSSYTFWPNLLVKKARIWRTLHQYCLIAHKNPVPGSVSSASLGVGCGNQVSVLALSHQGTPWAWNLQQDLPWIQLCDSSMKRPSFQVQSKVTHLCLKSLIFRTTGNWGESNSVTSSRINVLTFSLYFCGLRKPEPTCGSLIEA